MSDAAAAVGAGMMVRHQGKEYALSPLDVDMLALFERWLEERAFAAVEARKHRSSVEDYERMLSVVVEQCAAGRYRYGCRAAREAARSIEGQKFLAFLMLSKSSQAMTPKLAGEIWDSQVQELTAKMEAVNADPFEDGAVALATPTVALATPTPATPAREAVGEQTTATA